MVVEGCLQPAGYEMPPKHKNSHVQYTALEALPQLSVYASSACGWLMLTSSSTVSAIQQTCCKEAGQPERCTQHEPVTRERWSTRRPHLRKILAGNPACRPPPASLLRQDHAGPEQHSGHKTHQKHTPGDTTTVVINPSKQSHRCITFIQRQAAVVDKT